MISVGWGSHPTLLYLTQAPNFSCDGGLRTFIAKPSTIVKSYFCRHSNADLLNRQAILIMRWGPTPKLLTYLTTILSIN